MEVVDVGHFVATGNSLMAIQFSGVLIEHQFGANFFLVPTEEV
jgi:hypothetical protein